MIFEYVETKEEAARIARAALPLANKFDLPANPINYAVLYEFVTGQNSELCQVLESALRDETKLTSSDIFNLYSTYISRGDEQVVLSMREALLELFQKAGDSLGKMRGRSSEFESELENCAEQLRHEEPQNLTQLVERLLEQTNSIRQSSEVLKNELEAAKNELESLRSEFQRVKKEALIDPLTGVSNRRAFDAELDEASKTHAGSSVPMCLLLLDVDHFKRVNDAFGHLVGDAVLKWFAKVLRETIRGTDLVARYGGEEFAILLPDTSLAGAKIVAENIRRRVREQNLRVGQHHIGKISCSIGIAAITPECDVSRWVASADSAMYRAKQSGRDQVVVHGLQ